MTQKPTDVTSSAQKELDKAEKQFEEFDKNIKEMTFERTQMASKNNQESQTQIAQKDLEKMQDIYLKPIKTVSCRDKFNEKFREQYEYDKVYVQFTAEHYEIKGDDIDLWTRPYGGMPAEEWRVPTNKPVWGPRYLAEQIKRCRYARLIMQDHKTIKEINQAGTMWGVLAVDTMIQRLDAHPVSTKKTIFMGAANF